MGLSLRIKQFIEYEGVTTATFERECKLSNGTVSKMGEGTRRATLDKVSMRYPQLNITWLLTGEGQMLKSTPTQQSSGDNSPNVMGNNNMVGNTITTTPAQVYTQENAVRPIVPVELYKKPTPTSITKSSRSLLPG